MNVKIDGMGYRETISRGPRQEVTFNHPNLFHPPWQGMPSRGTRRSPYGS